METSPFSGDTPDTPALCSMLVPPDPSPWETSVHFGLLLNSCPISHQMIGFGLVRSPGVGTTGQSHPPLPPVGLSCCTLENTFSDRQCRFQRNVPFALFAPMTPSATFLSLRTPLGGYEGEWGSPGSW